MGLDHAGRGVPGNDAAHIHDCHFVAEVFRLFHGVGGHDNGLSFRFYVADNVPQIPAGLRIKAG